MDRLLEESGAYKKLELSDIKCKNFAICQNYIPKDYIKHCEQINGDYLCPDCIQKEDKDSMGKD